MYESHFNLTQRPFLVLPSADRYFPAGDIEDARRRLLRCVERGEGPALVVGPPGTGKTLLAAVLADQFRDELQVASLTSGRLGSRRDLLQAILHVLGERYQDREQGELRLALIDHLSNTASDQRPVLLLLDDAHDLADESLDEIRMIADLVRSGQPAVRLVLLGKPQLEEQISRPSLDSLEQRIAARCYLGNLTKDEVHQYVAAQVQASGGDSLFTDCAIDAIYLATDGVPRLVNQVCDHALVLACTAGLQELNATTIEEAWADMQQLPLPSTAAAGPESAEIIEFGALESDGEQLGPNGTGDAEDQAAPTASVAETQIDAIQDQLETVEQDSSREPELDPQATISLAVTAGLPECANPLDEEFEEEEVVVDHFGGLTDQPFLGRTAVSGIDQTAGIAATLVPPPDSDHASRRFVAGQESVGVLDPVMPDTAAPLQRDAAPFVADHSEVEIGSSDQEMITVDDEATSPRFNSVHRPEFRQLFAQLRRRRQRAV